MRIIVNGSVTMRPTKETEAYVARADKALKDYQAALEHWLKIVKDAQDEHITPDNLEQLLLDSKDPEKDINLAKAELRQVDLGLDREIIKQETWR